MSRRHRWAAAASALALLAGYGVVGPHNAQAASSQAMTDPTGDATNLVDANGGTTAVANEPRADVVSASATYQAGAIVLSLRTAQPVSPTGDPSGARAS